MIYSTAGALSSVSNTLMNVVSKGYEGNKRSQETAPLLQDQNASPEAHVSALRQCIIIRFSKNVRYTSCKVHE